MEAETTSYESSVVKTRIYWNDFFYFGGVGGGAKMLVAMVSFHGPSWCNIVAQSSQLGTECLQIQTFDKLSSKTS